MNIRRYILQLLIVPLSNAWALEPYLDRPIAGVQSADAVLNMSHHDSDPKSVTNHPPIREHLDSALKNDGVVLVIHKLTTGVGKPDGFYQQHLDEARDLHLMWGAYHFCKRVKYTSSGSRLDEEGARKQADNFIDSVIEHKAKKDTKILLAVDLEPYNTGRKIVVKGKLVDEQEAIDVQDAYSVVRQIVKRTGVFPLIYVGNPWFDTYYYKPIFRLASLQLRTAIKDLFKQCPLWYPEYEVSSPNIPWGTPWGTSWALWQYTTNPYEVKQTCHAIRHRAGDKFGELDYVAMPREGVEKWFNEHAWDFTPPKQLPQSFN